jgi:hypothetical protein
MPNPLLRNSSFNFAISTAFSVCIANLLVKLFLNFRAFDLPLTAGARGQAAASRWSTPRLNDLEAAVLPLIIERQWEVKPTQADKI